MGAVKLDRKLAADFKAPGGLDTTCRRRWHHSVGVYLPSQTVRAIRNQPAETPTRPFQVNDRRHEPRATALLALMGAAEADPSSA
jgi:hypothetical protein